MRPRKRVLILQPDPVRASLLRFQMDIWGYSPLVASASDQAARLLEAEPTIDALAVFCEGAEALIEETQRKYKSINVLLVSAAHLDGHADQWLPANATNAMIRETLRIAVCHRSWTPRVSEVCDVAAD